MASLLRSRVLRWPLARSVSSRARFAAVSSREGRSFTSTSVLQTPEPLLNSLNTLTEEEEALRESARRFVEEYLPLEKVREMDEQEKMYEAHSNANVPD